MKGLMILNILSHINLVHIISLIGYAGIFGLVFAETGLLVGIFLPGESLVFVAGFLAFQGYLNIFFLIPIVFAAAVIGDNIAYTFGKRVGRRLFSQKDSRFFHEENLQRAEKFYEKYGAVTIIVARFVPYLRTFAPIVAGISKMKYKTFVIFNLLGSAVWATSITLIGFYLGKMFPGLGHNSSVVIGLIFLIILVPIIIGLAVQKKK
jgi:membrane-associated protein